MNSKSQKVSYAENRRLYFDKVIELYSQGMSACEVANRVPISRSTVQRWIDEYINRDGVLLPEDMAIPRTPGSVAKTIQAMNVTIRELKQRLVEAEYKSRQLDAIAKILHGELGAEAVLGSELVAAHTKSLRLSYTIQKTRPRKDGSYNIKIMLPRNGEAAFISTPFSVKSLEEWNDGVVINRVDADEMNKQMRNLLSFYKELSQQLWGSIDGKSATETKQMLLLLVKQYIPEK